MKSSSATKSRYRARDQRALKHSTKPVGRAHPAFWLGLLLIVATVAVYAPVHTHPFANFDDGPYVFSNPHVQDGLSWNTVKWAFTSFGSVTPDVPDWHPLTWLSHAADTQIFGPDPAGPHDVNLFLHVLNVLLLFWILKQATGFAGRSAMVAALFALHPINVESVAWISERKNLLSMWFFLLALAAYRWYVSEPRVGRYIAVAVCFALGLMAKPQVITLPFVLLLWDYWPLQRMLLTSAPTSPVRHADTEFSARSFWWLVKEKLPLFAIAAVSAIVTVKSQLAIGSIDSDKRMSFSIRLGNAIVSYVRYLEKALWPTHLALFYPHPRASLQGWRVLAALVVLLAISALVIWQRHRRYLLVGWLWFLGTLVPMIGLVQLNRQAMADRYAYLSFLGLFILVSWGVAEFSERRRISSIWIRSVSCAVLLALAVVAYRQIGFWGDNLTLWSHTLEVTQGNFLAENIVGSTLMEEGQLDAALPHFQAAIEMDPSDPSAYMYLGAYDQQTGKLPQAIEQFEKTITLTDSAAQRNLWLRSNTFARLASVYRQMGDLQRARQNYRKALDINPNDGQVWLALGIVTQLSGNSPEAIQAYSKAIQIHPSDEGYLLLARALQQSGNSAAAQAAFTEAQRHSSDLAGAERRVDAIFAQQPAPPAAAPN